MTIGHAIQHIKYGGKATREGWNDKKQYIQLDIHFTFPTLENINGETDYHQDINSQSIVFVGTGGSQTGWLPTQADLLANDWILL